jgi:16S rRNA (uracil1498-N3)-methyltransferase
MHRFFVAPEVLDRQPIVLGGEQAHQIRQVLRIRPGEGATLLDNRGWAYEASLVSYDGSDARFEVIRRWVATGEPRTNITLYQAVLKGERFGWALQKGTEVGVIRFVPMICERNVVADMRAVAQKRARWERIIQEAAEQSGRARLPVLAPAQTFESIVRTGSLPQTTTGSLRLILWEDERAATLRQILARCNFEGGARIEVLVGPEGGFTIAEASLAERAGAQRVTLGPRILRAETAGLVAAASILYEAGEMSWLETGSK